MRAGECAVCLSNDDVERVTLSCGHAFHLHCMHMAARYSNVCPLCRAELDVHSTHTLMVTSRETQADDSFVRMAMWGVLPPVQRTDSDNQTLELFGGIVGDVWDDDVHEDQVFGLMLMAIISRGWTLWSCVWDTCNIVLRVMFTVLSGCE